MGKKSIRLISAAVVVGCLSAGYLWLRALNERETQEAAQDAVGDTILDVNTANLTSVSFTIKGEQVTFEKQEDGWILSGDPEFPVDESALLTPFTQMAPLRAVRTLEGVEDCEQYGLEDEDAQNIITFTDEDGTETAVTIGDTNDSTGNDYVMLNEDAQTVYTVESTLRTAFSDDLYDYAAGEELPYVSAADITEVAVSESHNDYRLYLEDALWKMDYGEVQNADSDTVNDALAQLSGLSYLDYLEYDCQEPALYGLDKPQASLTIQYLTDEEQESSESTKELCLLVGDLDDSGNYYVQQKGSAEVHTISASVLDTFLGAEEDAWLDS